MAVRSDALGGTSPVAAGANANLFTVPAGQTWLVKRATAYNGGVLAGSLLYVCTLVGSGAHGLYRAAIAAGSADDHETWWAIDAGGILAVANTGATALTVQCFGAKLIGVA